MKSSQTVAPGDLFGADLARAHDELSAPSWLTALRRAGEARFRASGLPTTAQEEWRYTSLAAIAKGGFRWSGGTGAGRDLSSVAASALPALEAGSMRLVFVDGAYAADLSTLGPESGAGVWVGSLAAALAESPPWLEQHLGRYAAPDHSALVGLNTAFADDGALLHLPPGTRLSGPLHILFVAAGACVAAHPRVLICAGERSAATVVEEYRSAAGASTHYNNAVVEMSLGTAAEITHVRLVAENEGGCHTAMVQVRQGADSRYNCHQVTTGGALVRVDTRVELAAPGAECVLRGLYALRGTMHADHHTFVDHASPECHSDERFKGVVDDAAHAVFNGRVLVRPDAQQTVATQQNPNVLLSPDACVDTKPELEIYADDVKCEHGATIGQMDPLALFYLQSRGLDQAAARTMLIRGFAAEIIDGIGVPGLGQRLHDELFGSAPQPSVVAASSGMERS